MEKLILSSIILIQLFLLTQGYSNISISLNEKEFIYDEKRDIIYYKGNMYFPNAHFLNSNEIKEQAETIKISSSIRILNKKEEHEEISEGQFWFYIFCITCNYFLKKLRPNNICWNDVRTDCWILIN